MQCRYHPDREAYIQCQKMGVGYCRECLENCEACTDPCTYCKYRPQCIIWELCKKSEKRYRLERQSKGEWENESENEKGQKEEEMAWGK
ncbi:MAG: hypothetical protein JRI80_03955 [Deltaproteobacteria bacterium]|nr:hypothetical protein [Deltaproteobacteria bacterium]